MEEKPPTERRGTPRARTPRPAFSAPEQPEVDDRPAERAPRRAAKAAPPVTFQPPSAEDHGGGSGAKTPSGTQRRPAPAQSAGGPAAAERESTPRKGRQPKAAPAKRPGRPAASTGPAEAAQGPAPIPAQPARATPAKKATAANDRPTETAATSRGAAKGATTSHRTAKETTTGNRAARDATTGNPATKEATISTRAGKGTTAGGRRAKAVVGERPDEGVVSDDQPADAAATKDHPVEVATSDALAADSVATPRRPTAGTVKKETTPAKKAGPAKRAPRKAPAKTTAAASRPASESAAVAPPEARPEPTTTPDIIDSAEPTPEATTPDVAAPTEHKPKTTTTPETAPTATARPDVTTPTKAEPAPAVAAGPEPESQTGSVDPATQPKPDATAAPAQPTVAATTTPVAAGPPDGALTPAVPIRPQTETEPVRVAGAAPTHRAEPWAEFLIEPTHAPELLALAAVQTFGPRAQDWADRTRAAYPKADDAALARLAIQQFTRFGGLASVFGAVAGSYAPVALLGSAAITQAELVLHVAAAYGLDPTDPQRAADLLVIVRVHPTRGEADAALAAAHDDAGGPAAAVWRLGRMIAAQAGGWALLRFANRRLPGTSLLAAVLSSTASAQTAAARADAYYRQARKNR